MSEMPENPYSDLPIWGGSAGSAPAPSPAPVASAPPWALAPAWNPPETDADGETWHVRAIASDPGVEVLYVTETHAPAGVKVWRAAFDADLPGRPGTIQSLDSKTVFVAPGDSFEDAVEAAKAAAEAAYLAFYAAS